ncbi:MAG: PAS domain S-box protein [Chloroflexi bacterium]|nr:PAS domain S-box protein [Chloroflexota bacterium]
MGPKSTEWQELQNLVKSQDSADITRGLLRSLGVGLYIVQQGKFVYVNSYFEDLSGYSREDLLGKNSLVIVHQDDQDFVRKNAISNLKSKKNPVPYEYRIIKKDGEIIWVSERIATSSYMKNRAAVGSFIDITEHKRLEEALLRTKERYRLVLQEMQDSYFEIDRAGNLLFVNEATCLNLGYSAEELTGMSYHKITPPGDSSTVFLTFNKVFTTGEPNSGFSHRILHKDGSITFSETSVSLLKNDQGQAAGFRCVGRNVTERKKLEEALLRSEERYRNILEEMQEAYFEVDLTGNFTFTNDAAPYILGYSQEEFIGKNFSNFIAEEDIELVKLAFNEVFRTGIPNKGFTYKIQRKNGSKVSVETAISLMKNERGKPIGFRCVSRDVTERIQLEEALKRSEENYRTVLEEIQNSYFELDLNGTITFANDAACRNMGYPKEEVIGLNFRTYTPPEDIKTMFNIYNTVYRTGEPDIGSANKLIRKDGTLCFMETSASLLKNEKGEAIGFKCISRDVTERMQLEEALKKSEENYRTVLEEIQNSYFELDLNGTITFANNAACHNMGYPREELIGLNYKAYTPPEDLFKIYNTLYRTGEPVKNFNSKLIRKDGTLCFMENSATPLRNDKGEVIGFKSVNRDITERKKLEEALIRSEERFRTILEQIEDVYIELDLEGNYTFVNDAFCHNMMYTQEETIGMLSRNIVYPEDRDKMFQAYLEVYRSGNPNKGIAFRVMRKDGAVGYSENSISAIKNERGEIIGFRSIGRDITERMAMQQKLAEMATHDFLTGLPNRVLFNDRFEVGIAQAQRHNSVMAVLSLDVDKFKNVNDTLGHIAGDQLLKSVGKRLSSIVRSSDTVARIGGDEFLLLLQEINHTEDIIRIADKILVAFNEPFVIDDHALNVSASIGIAVYPEDGDDLEALMKNSDAAMYNAKNAGRGCYRMYGNNP